MANPPLERPQSRREFLELLGSLEVPEENIVISERFGHGVRVASNGDRLLVTWEAHTEYYSYQVWHIPDDKMKPLEFGPLTFPQYRFPFSPLGIRVNALDILIVPYKLLEPVEIKSQFPGPQLYGSQVLGEDISVMTSFTPDQEVRERYLIVSSSADTLLKHLGQILENLIAIENYTHLLLLPFQAFTRSVDQVHKFEQRHLYQRGVISNEIDQASPQKLQQWLTVLTQDFMRVSRLAESMRYKLSASVPYDAIIRANMQALQERPLPGCRTISDYVSSKTIGVADGYQQLLKRIDALEQDFQGTIAVIRTKVELLLQEQNVRLQSHNRKLLSSLNKTTRSQAILQHTVEALSVIVVSYYLSGLGSYVFKALDELGWIDNAVLASGLFVPLAIGLSFVMIAVGRKFIQTRLFRDSSKEETKNNG
ncbi:MAG: DUF3422 family protein [Nitrospirae bacterium]|nr:MAG: DUF3422 family protein [Nitrospirota bacterium]